MLGPKTIISTITNTANCFTKILVLCTILLCTSLSTGLAEAFDLEQRVACQQIIEDIRWSYRIWPEENGVPKPKRSEILTDQQIRDKVDNSRRMEAALQGIYGMTIDQTMLQAELGRIASSTRAPRRLQELFDAFENNPNTIGECLVRPSLVQKHLYDHYMGDVGSSVSFSQWWAEQAAAWMVDEAGEPETIISMSKTIPVVTGEEYDFSMRGADPVTADSWAPPPEFPEYPRYWHKAVWSGSEMIIWGGQYNSNYYSGIWHYDPVTDSWEKVLAPDEPAVRANDQAIWSGSELIIWGGDSTEGLWLNTGWRYNPGNESWTAMTTTNAPVGRRGFTAVWSGSEMIIWGGQNSIWQRLNTGTKYDPSTDTWTSMTTIDAPVGRNGHSAVWSGTEMLVWGGVGSGWYDTGGRYNPSTDTWSSMTTTDAPTGRYEHTAVWSGSEMVVWGGRHHDGAVYVYNNTGGRYDPVSDSWTATTLTGAPEGRSWHTAVWTDGDMIIWGGSTDSIGYNTGGKYNPDTDSWTATTLTGAPEARGSHTVVWTGSEMIIWGGSAGGAAGARYNPVTDSWVPVTNSVWEPAVEAWGSAVWTGNEMIVWGGATTNEGGLYDPVLNEWQATSTLSAPAARYDHTAVWTGERMIVWGGLGSGYLNTGGSYDPFLDSWSAIDSSGAPSARRSHTAVWSGSEMIVWGGYSGSSSSHHNTGGRYNPTTDSWLVTTTTGAPVARREHIAVWSGNEMIVWGGWIGNTEFTSGGRYNPLDDSWLATNEVGAPPPRHAFTGVWSGSEMIVWGGEYWNGSSFYNLNSGGIYDPFSDTWATVTTTGAPGARNAHTAVWTGSDMIIWGGSGNTGGLYDPVADSWMATTTVGAPTGRYNHTAVWTGDEMIIWGGNTGTTGIYYPYSTYTVGGSVSGLGDGVSVVLQNNGENDLTITQNGDFTFARPLIDGSVYDVSVLTQPTTTGMYCGIPYSSGTLAGGHVIDVDVNCVTLSLESVIATLQVLTGMSPAAVDLEALVEIAPGGKPGLTEAIKAMRKLAN